GTVERSGETGLRPGYRSQGQQAKTGNRGNRDHCGGTGGRSSCKGSLKNRFGRSPLAFIMSSRHKLRVLAILSLGMLLIAAIAPPIPQPLEYHQFADQRDYFGIPNFFNVVSNLAFLFVGIAGLTFLLSSRVSSPYQSFIKPCERW